MTSLWDALCPYLDLLDALKMTECTHELKTTMTQRIDMIVKHDKHHSLALLTRAVMDTEDITLKMLKDFKMRVLARDMDIFLSLHKLPTFYTNNDLQDLYMNQCIYFDKDAYKDIDKQIVSILTVYLQTLDSQILEQCDKFSCFIFMIRLLTRFIKWIIQNGLQDNPNVDIFKKNSHYSFEFRSKIYHFLDRLYMVTDEKKRHEFKECIEENKGYINALVIKTYAPASIKLCIGSRGGIYRIHDNERVYF
jgi:hypothetical protein